VGAGGWRARLLQPLSQPLDLPREVLRFARRPRARAALRGQLGLERILARGVGRGRGRAGRGEELPALRHVEQVDAVREQLGGQLPDLGEGGRTALGRRRLPRA
jgi:hypothetical protein